jgi:hypothetical protein
MTLRVVVGLPLLVIQEAGTSALFDTALAWLSPERHTEPGELLPKPRSSCGTQQGPTLKWLSLDFMNCGDLQTGPIADNSPSLVANRIRSARRPVVRPLCDVIHLIRLWLT